MYAFLILFFLSLASIIFMLWRKLTLVKNGHITPQEHAHPFVPDVQKVKDLTIANAKRLEHMALVAMVRSYVRTLNVIKNNYQKFRTKMAQIKNGSTGSNGEIVAGGEASKFLKMISDYKQKIREIKHRIHEEEKKQ